MGLEWAVAFKAESRDSMEFHMTTPRGAWGVFRAIRLGLGLSRGGWSWSLVSDWDPYWGKFVF